MSTDGYKMYIDGQWVNHDETFADYNPATAEVWAQIPNGTREHARKAIASAAAFYPGPGLCPGGGEHRRVEALRGNAGIRWAVDRRAICRSGASAGGF